MQETSDSVNSIEIEISSLRGEISEQLESNSTANEGKEKVLEAKVEDLSDRLRLGMNKLQTAIGDINGGGGGGGATGQTVSLDEAEAMYAEDIEGVKEKVAAQAAELEEKITELRNEVRRQDEVIEGKIKMVSGTIGD